MPKSLVWLTLVNEKEFKSRDGSAFIELLPELLSRGYVFGGQCLNVPVKSRCSPPKVIPPTPPPEFAWLKDIDLLVLTIRPPINDHLVVGDAKRPLPRSYSWLECTAVNLSEQFFFLSSFREEIKIG